MADTPTAVKAARLLLLRRDAAHWMRTRGRTVQPELPPETRKQYQEAYALLDSDGSGTLDEEEVWQGFKALNLPTSRAAVRHMVAAMCEPGVGVTYAGFERLMAARREEMPRGGAAAPPPVPLAVMARSLQRAKLLNAVLAEREAALAEFQVLHSAAGAEAPQAEAEEAAPAAEETPAAQEATGAAPDEEERQEQPAGLHASPPSTSGSSEPPAFVFRPKARRRSVLISIGDMQKLVPFEM